MNARSFAAELEARIQSRTRSPRGCRFRRRRPEFLSTFQRRRRKQPSHLSHLTSLHINLLRLHPASTGNIFDQSTIRFRIGVAQSISRSPTFAIIELNGEIGMLIDVAVGSLEVADGFDRWR